MQDIKGAFTVKRSLVVEFIRSCSPQNASDWRVLVSNSIEKENKRN